MFYEWVVSFLFLVLGPLSGWLLPITSEQEMSDRTQKKEHVTQAESLEADEHYPFNLGGEVKFVGGVCNFEELAEQMETLITESVEPLPVGWQVLEVIRATTTVKGDRFAEAAGVWFNPCHYSVTFTDRFRGDTLVQRSSWEFERQIHDRLANVSGLVDEMNVMLSEVEGVGPSLGLSLLAADGPLSSERVYLKTIPGEGEIQFVRVRERSNRENWLADRASEAESACPCYDDVTLSITGIVDITPLLR